MSALAALASYTIKHHLRHRVYLILLIFGVLMLGGVIVLSALAPDQRLRILFDLGLAGIEVIALVATVFLMVNLILEEMESRTIYLILTHPVPRHTYILGRFAGTMCAVLAGMALMALLHLALLLPSGWDASWAYGAAWTAIALKMVVVGGLALVLSLFSSSANTAMVLTVFLWILGHFTSEMSFLAMKSQNMLIQGAVWLTRSIVPDMSYFNYRDFVGAAIVPGAAWFGWLAVYAAAYTAVCLYLSSLLVSHKEF